MSDQLPDHLEEVLADYSASCNNHDCCSKRFSAERKLRTILVAAHHIADCPPFVVDEYGEMRCAYCDHKFGSHYTDTCPAAVLTEALADD